ncbi:MAG: ASCH domain-containing protein [Ponticaulis sp.]|nr:ASCH domain-containing protein [Ponticaulis sp.]|tara:strand:- start:26145 stop:26600 length:456 start_codon:yes stop_codon:yes gene_type:complete
MTLPAAYADLPLWPFGDSHELQERLAALIVAGVKTAGCGAKDLNEWSEPGERGLLVIRDTHPVALLEIETVEHMKFDEMSAEKAALEGEGDLSLEFWQEAHRKFFTRVTTFSEDMDVVFETFRLVEILDQDFAADAPRHVALERAEAGVGA